MGLASPLHRTSPSQGSCSDAREQLLNRDSANTANGAAASRATNPSVRGYARRGYQEQPSAETSQHKKLRSGHLTDSRPHPIRRPWPRRDDDVAQRRQLIGGQLACRPDTAVGGVTTKRHGLVLCNARLHDRGHRLDAVDSGINVSVGHAALDHREQGVCRAGSLRVATGRDAVAGNDRNPRAS